MKVSPYCFVFDHAKMDGVPRIHDPDLFDRYFILETLENGERDAALMVLDALIAKKRLGEIMGGPGNDSAKKTNPKQATA